MAASNISRIITVKMSIMSREKTLVSKYLLSQKSCEQLVYISIIENSQAHACVRK